MRSQSTGAAFAGALKCAAEIDAGVVVFLSRRRRLEVPLVAARGPSDLDEVTERARKTLYF